MSDTCRYKYLVIDNQDLLEINNLKRKTNQAIKQPSDNWDRNSNEPAIGSPPYCGPGPKE